MASPHILGKFRYPICYGASAVASVVELSNSGDMTRGLVAAAVGFGLSWLASTEKALKFGMAAIIGALVFGVALVIAWLLPNSDSKGLLLLIGAVLGLGAAYLGYKKINSSSWIGEPCPQCHERGGLTHSVTDKQYLGKKTMGTGYGNKKTTNNVYQVTTQHSCGSCGHEWTTTKEKQEYSSGSRGFGMDPVN
jgi:hypothetical protein